MVKMSKDDAGVKSGRKISYWELCNSEPSSRRRTPRATLHKDQIGTDGQTRTRMVRRIRAKCATLLDKKPVV